MPIFNFKLYPFKECALPLTRKKYIGYYWLTDSIFYVKLGNVKIYESSKEYIKKYKE